MKNKRAAAIAVIASGALWGIVSIFIRALSSYGLESQEISGIRLPLAALIYLAFVLLRDRDALKVRIRDMWVFACMGMGSVVVFNTLYFYAIIKSQASVAVVLMYTSPIFVMLMSAIFFKEKITPVKMLAVVMTFAGCVCVAGLTAGRLQIPAIVLLAGLGSGLFYALYSIFGQVALSKYDTVTVTTYAFIFAGIGAIPIGNTFHTAAMMSHDAGLAVWVVASTVLCTVTPYFLYTWGLSKMEASKAAILVAVEPLVASVVGMTVFHESHGVIKIAGIALIIASIILLNLDTEKITKILRGSAKPVVKKHNRSYHFDTKEGSAASAVSVTGEKREVSPDHIGSPDYAGK